MKMALFNRKQKVSELDEETEIVGVKSKAKKAPEAKEEAETEQGKEPELTPEQKKAVERLNEYNAIKVYSAADVANMPDVVYRAEHLNWLFAIYCSTRDTLDVLKQELEGEKK